MKVFKFGQLLSKEDICDRRKEIQLLTKICMASGRAVIYGPRRFGKTSVIKNVIMADFAEKQEKSLVIYADFLQVDSMGDVTLRFQSALEQAISQGAKIKSFIKNIQNYIKHFRVEVALDPLSGAPTVSLAGNHARDERSLPELFMCIKNFSEEYKTLLVLDEFQDIRHIPGLEAMLRSEIQNLNKSAVVLLGSKKHFLREIFHDESKPFYGFGTDIEFREIPRNEWVPYMQERFAPSELTIDEKGVIEICNLMRDVPNSIQELCQWITLSGQSGFLNIQRIHENLAELIENKSSRYTEKITTFSHKEKKVLFALANQEPVSSPSSTRFLQATGVSATATKATVLRLAEQGLLDQSEAGYLITDPLFKIFLLRKFGHSGR
ncbi:MAG: ATP-binding protein [Deltaproteobacteria bacterium]|nr:ATP-binding protein [Deltaproteobacteria bacterium]